MKHVVIVGGGFAGLGCARKLASHPDVRVTLLDKNNYHQFQPLLYQVAGSALSPAMLPSTYATCCSDIPTLTSRWAKRSPPI